jgi:hypothetical protein
MKKNLMKWNNFLNEASKSSPRLKLRKKKTIIALIIMDHSKQMHLILVTVK